MSPLPKRSTLILRVRSAACSDGIANPAPVGFPPSPIAQKHLFLSSTGIPRKGNATVSHCVMKICFSPNNIRIRLQAGEITRFDKEGCLSECLSLPGPSRSQLHFSLIQTAQEEFSVNLLSNHLRIYVPDQLSETWCRSGQNALKAELDCGTGSSLQVSLEKDIK